MADLFPRSTRKKYWVIGFNASSRLLEPSGSLNWPVIWSSAKFKTDRVISLGKAGDKVKFLSILAFTG